MSIEQRAFTLIEVLVVIVIIAITLSVSSLSFRNTDIVRMRQSIDQLLQEAHYLSEKSVFFHRDYLLIIDSKGFYVKNFRNGEWVNSLDDQYLKFHTWPTSLEVANRLQPKLKSISLFFFSDGTSESVDGFLVLPKSSYHVTGGLLGQLDISHED